jgi:hypothetical protein
MVNPQKEGRCSLQWLCVYVQVFWVHARARTRSVIKYRLQMLPKKTNLYKDWNLRKKFTIFGVDKRILRARNYDISFGFWAFVFFLIWAHERKYSHYSKIILTTSYLLTTSTLLMCVYRVIQEKMSIVWDVLVSVIVRKNVNINICIILTVTQIQFYKYTNKNNCVSGNKKGKAIPLQP